MKSKKIQPIFSPISKNHRINTYRSFLSSIILNNSQIPTNEITPIAQTQDLIQSKFNDENYRETIASLWPYFKFCRFIGLMPIIRKNSSLLIGPFYHFSWLSTYVGYFVASTMLLNTFKKLKASSGTTDEFVNNLNDLVYYGHVWLNYSFMIWRVRKIVIFIGACSRIEKICAKYESLNIGKNHGDELVKHCFWLYLFMSGLQFAGNFLYYFAIATQSDVKNVGDFFKTFSSDFFGNLDPSASGIFFCLGEFFSDQGWTFGDILLALISLILSRFFIRLNKALIEISSSSSVEKIERVRMDHREICQLVTLTNDIFSPLFLLTYVFNIFYLFARLYIGLEADISDAHLPKRVEGIFALIFQILVKILLPSYLAATLHENAHGALEIIHSWHSGLDKENSKFRLLVIGRFVSQLVTTQVGISGCGYFIITKSFIVTLISAVITYEVIILQFQEAGKN